MAGQIAPMFSTIENFITRLIADMECAIRLLSLMRTANILTFVTTAIHISLAHAITNVLLSSLGYFFWRKIGRSRSRNEMIIKCDRENNKIKIIIIKLK